MTQAAHEHVFRVRHQEKQRILLRALEQMGDNSESPPESAAITEMIVRLETLIKRRKRSRCLVRE